jgi:hypothetical protein
MDPGSSGKINPWMFSTEKKIDRQSNGMTDLSQEQFQFQK